MNHFHIPDSKLKVVPYGMDLDRFLSQMSEQPDPPVDSNGRFIMACVARIDPVKGHKTLLKALGRLKEKRDDFVCWLIGGCYQQKLLKELEQDCRERQLENHIGFMGNRSDVPALLQRADVMILPSLQENHPFAVMEAQVTDGRRDKTKNIGGYGKRHPGRIYFNRL